MLNHQPKTSRTSFLMKESFSGLNLLLLENRTAMFRETGSVEITTLRLFGAGMQIKPQKINHKCHHLN